MRHSINQFVSVSCVTILIKRKILFGKAFNIDPSRYSNSLFCVITALFSSINVSSEIFSTCVSQFLRKRYRPSSWRVNLDNATMEKLFSMSCFDFQTQYAHEPQAWFRSTKSWHIFASRGSWFGKSLIRFLPRNCSRPQKGFIWFDIYP